MTTEKLVFGIGHIAGDHLLYDDPRRWPLINRSLVKGAHKAKSTQVEWLVDRVVTCRHCGSRQPRLVSEKNYTQIFRDEFNHLGEGREALARLFDHLEYSLREGMLYKSTNPPFSMAMKGIVPILARWPHADDEVRLSILRPLEPRTITHDEAGVILDYPRYEWLIECSCIAKAAS